MLDVFKEHWERSKYHKGDIFRGKPFTINNKLCDDELSVLFSSLIFPVTEGQIGVLIFSPANENTAQHFQNILKVAGNRSFETSRWPDKPPYRS